MGLQDRIQEARAQLERAQLELRNSTGFGSRRLAQMSVQILRRRLNGLVTEMAMVQRHAG